MKPVICIAGPTASGKSAFALDVARAMDGEIFNADALQVYAELQVLSARPTRYEMAGIPHHLFGHVSGAIRYSTGQWLREVELRILDSLARGKTPVLVGGTGLYFRALLQGMADIPAVSPETSTASKVMLADKGIAALRREAERLDPRAAARVLGDDPQRVDVATGTGRPLSEWQAETHPVVPLRFARYCVLMPPRDTLYAKIDARYDAMLRGGGLEEARALFAKNLDETLPVMKAIGLRQLRSYFSGLTPLDEAVETAKRESRRVAKRQTTWFRNQPPKAEMLRAKANRDAFLRSVKDLEL